MSEAGESLSEVKQAYAKVIDDMKKQNKLANYARFIPSLYNSIKGLREKIKEHYPAATIEVGRVFMVFTPTRPFVFPTYERTGYIVLESQELDEGTVHWGESL